MLPNSIFNKRILIAPLDWGIGHATRCVSLIEQLKTNNTLVIGVTENNRLFFAQLFPVLELVELPSYNMRYHATLPAWLWVLMQRNRLQKIIKQEHEVLKQVVSEKKIELIISDNRFGCYHSEIHSIYITHQLFIKAPYFRGIAQKINQNYILKFNEVWIPDFEDEKKSLSGSLSHGKQYHPNISYIEPLSRMKKVIAEKKEFDFLIILSGAEPQQTIFKELLMRCFANYPHKKIALIHTDVKNYVKNNIHFINGLHPLKLAECIAKSEVIICRSGYSTLMDLFSFLPKKIILIPTPGQPEQLYLAEHWRKNFGSEVVEQRNILSKSLKGWD
jgi:uncharacterized protein (TIGR00661 family)